MPSKFQSSFYSKSYTATADTIFQVEDETDVVLTSVNVACYGADAYYGNMTIMSAVIRANAVLWFDAPIRLADLYFKNYTAGSNATIVITGTLPVV
jgi:hypothetical protein